MTKVVCIYNYNENLTINKIYDSTPLLIGIFAELTKDDPWIVLKNDIDEISSYPEKYFKYLSTVRDDIINNLLNDTKSNY